MNKMLCSSLIGSMVATATAQPTQPPADLAVFADLTAGTWTCTGEGRDRTNQMLPMKSKVRSRSDLDGWWVQETFDGTVGKARFKTVAYTTYDAAAKTWRRVSVDNHGMQLVGTSDGVKDGKIVFDLETRFGGMVIQFKDTFDLSGRRTLKSWGELSFDKGATWMRVYDAACTK